MNLKKLAIILLIVFVIAGAGFYYYIQMLMQGVGPVGPGAEANPQYNFSILETGVVDYGANGSRSLYILYSVAAQDLQNLSLEARRYPSDVPTDIYLLDYPCDVCAGKEEFARSLEETLKLKGFIAQNASLSVVKINQLERITKRGIVIIQSERMPSDLLDKFSDASLLRLMALGDVVIYIGGDFGSMLDRDKVFRPTTPEMLSSMNLSYSETSGPGTSPPYRLERSSFSMPLASVVANSIYVKKIGNGYFVAFPDTLDQGWSIAGPVAAGEDVAEFIYRTDWQSPITTGNSTVDFTQSPTARKTLFLAPSRENGGYTRLYLAAANPDGSEFRHEYIDLNITNQVTGRMSHSAFGVNGSVLDFTISFSENFSEPREINIFLKAYQDQVQVQEQDLGIVTFVSTYERRMRYNVNLEGGDHILRIEDIAGKKFAQSFLHIPEVTVDVQDQFWERPAFTFALLSDGIPVSNTKVVVLMDGKYNTTLRTDGSGLITFTPPAPPDYGDHVFTFEATGKTMDLKLTRVKQTTFFDDPKNQILVVASIIVAVLGIALQRTEPPKYNIDVPDFPPQKRERIPLSRYSIINLIESTNKDYRWKYMPLSIEELKAGVKKKLTYQGRPIMMSDYNLEKLLAQLIEGGEVFQSLGLYGLNGWLSQSNKSPRHLAIFRMLRNFFINHAILFTDIGQRPDCDVLVNYRGENLFTHIYEGDETVRKALLLARKGKNAIIFEREEELSEFMRRLSTSATGLSVALKMEMDNRQIILTHAGALGVLVGRAG